MAVTKKQMNTKKRTDKKSKTKKIIGNKSKTKKRISKKSGGGNPYNTRIVPKSTSSSIAHIVQKYPRPPTARFYQKTKQPSTKNCFSNKNDKFGFDCNNNNNNNN